MPGTRQPHPLWSLLGNAFAGAAAIMIVLAVLLPLYMLFKIDYAPTLVSNAIIERTPPDNAIALQNLLGPLSFPFALLGGIMLVGMMGLLVGLVYAAVRRVNLTLAVAVGAILAPLTVWVFFADHMTPVALLPLLAVGPLLYLLTRQDAKAISSGEGISRREVLKRVAIFSFGGLILSVIDGFPVFLAALNSAKPGAKLFDFTPPAPRSAGFPVPDAPPEVTPAEKFYEMRKFPNVVPPAPPDFKLLIDGLVNKPLQLSLEDLYALPRQDVYITRQCVSNPVGGNLISTAYFSGALLAQVIEKAGIQASAIQLKFYGRDGYDESIPVAYALQYGLIVYAMNGTYLSDAHGAPLKMEVPGLYGFKNMKWLTRIEAIATPYQGVWAREGWTESAVYKTMSRIDTVTRHANGATLAGIAFAGIRGIRSVEVQVNNGGWQPATLHTPPLSDRTWVQWRYETPQTGPLTVSVRAVDGTGAPQIETKQTQFPDGASGLHTVEVK